MPVAVSRWYLSIMQASTASAEKPIPLPQLATPAFSQQHTRISSRVVKPSSQWDARHAIYAVFLWYIWPAEWLSLERAELQASQEWPHFTAMLKCRSYSDMPRPQRSLFLASDIALCAIMMSLLIWHIDSISPSSWTTPSRLTWARDSLHYSPTVWVAS